jgi:DNA-binding PadR family transcriptional regulator
MGIREGLLALLADQPKHGYQLKLDLEAATGDSISINVGQIYSTLQRLERDGLIEDGGKDSDGRDIYQITAPGQAALTDWATEAVNLAAAGRDEISLKVLIALSTEGLDPSVVIEHQRRFTMGLLQDLTQLRSREVDSDLAWQLHLDRLMYSAEAELKWLDRVEERLNTFKPAEKTTQVETQIEEGV